MKQGYNRDAGMRAWCGAMWLLVWGVLGNFNIFAIIGAIFIRVGLDHGYERWLCWKIPVLVLHILTVVYSLSFTIFWIIWLVIIVTDKYYYEPFALAITAGLSVLSLGAGICSFVTFSSYMKVYPPEAIVAYPAPLQYGYLPPPQVPDPRQPYAIPPSQVVIPSEQSKAS